MACGGQPRAKLPLAVYEDGLALERRANGDRRKTREKLYDQARANYKEACARGHDDACERYGQLDQLLRERRGVCETPDACLDQARLWLPESRGAKRLRALCLGDRIKFEFGTPPPAWDPDGSACVAVADYYRDAGRAEPALFYYDKGCNQAGFAAACRGGGQLTIDRARALDQDSDTLGKPGALRVAVGKLNRGCELEDVDSCRLLARVALARQRLRFPDEFSLRFASEEGSPREHLDAARDAASRACDLGAEDACGQVANIDEMIARIEGILKMGCAFLDDCGDGEICNKKTGLCESSKVKGTFYRAYELGIRKFDARDYAAARVAFEQARDMNPDLPGPWRWLGLIAKRQKRHAECVKLLSEALDLNPTSRHAPGLEQIREQCRRAVPKK